MPEAGHLTSFPGTVLPLKCHLTMTVAAFIHLIITDAHLLCTHINIVLMPASQAQCRSSPNTDPVNTVPIDNLLDRYRLQHNPHRQLLAQSLGRRSFHACGGKQGAFPCL
jgi:hypothetical protein